MEYADVWILVDKRDSKIVKPFLVHFLREFKSGIDEWGIPNAAKIEEQIFVEDWWEVASYCESHPEEYQCLFWSSMRQQDPFHAQIDFTDDAQMIFCLVVEQERREVQWLEELKAYFGSSNGFISYNCAAPQNAREFLEVCRQKRSYNFRSGEWEATN